MVSLKTKAEWNLSRTIFYTSAKTNLKKGNFLIITCVSSIKKKKTGRIWNVSNAPIEEKGVSSFDVQMNHLRKKIVVLVVPKLATIIILGKAFISNYVAKIRPMTNYITLFNSSPVTIVDVARLDHGLTVKRQDLDWHLEGLTEKRSYVTSRTTSHAAIGKTYVEVKTSTGDIESVGINEHVIQKRQALAMQGVVETRPEVRLNIKVSNLILSFTTILKGMKIN